MRGQYVFLLALMSALFGWGAYSLVFGNSEAASFVGQAVTSTPATPILSAKDIVKKSEGYVPEETITLSRSNTVSFRNIVLPDTVAKAQMELLTKSKSLPKGAPIYLVLDTPGGDINAGMQLADTARGLGRPVHTITNFAASMGFYLVQRLGKRYITPSGTLMAHRARVEGVGGQVPGEFLTAVNLIYRQVTKMEMQNAARLGISFEKYTALVKDEYWVTGEDAVVAGAADSLVNIKCDDSLSGTTAESFQTLFGEATVEYSNCPAISSPLSIHFANQNEEAQRYRNDYSLFRRSLLRK